MMKKFFSKGLKKPKAYELVKKRCKKVSQTTLPWSVPFDPFSIFHRTLPMFEDKPNTPLITVFTPGQLLSINLKTKEIARRRNLPHPLILAKIHKYCQSKDHNLLLLSVGGKEVIYNIDKNKILTSLQNETHRLLHQKGFQDYLLNVERTPLKVTISKRLTHNLSLSKHILSFSTVKEDLNTMFIPVYKLGFCLKIRMKHAHGIIFLYNIKTKRLMKTMTIGLSDLKGRIARCLYNSVFDEERCVVYNSNFFIDLFTLNTRINPCRSRKSHKKWNSYVYGAQLSLLFPEEYPPGKSILSIFNKKKGKARGERLGNSVFDYRNDENSLSIYKDGNEKPFLNIWNSKRIGNTTEIEMVRGHVLSTNPKAGRFITIVTKKAEDHILFLVKTVEPFGLTIISHKPFLFKQDETTAESDESIKQYFLKNRIEIKSRRYIPVLDKIYFFDTEKKLIVRLNLAGIKHPSMSQVGKKPQFIFHIHDDLTGIVEWGYLGKRDKTKWFEVDFITQQTQGNLPSGKNSASKNWFYWQAKKQLFCMIADKNRIQIEEFKDRKSTEFWSETFEDEEDLQARFFSSLSLTCLGNYLLFYRNDQLYLLNLNTKKFSQVSLESTGLPKKKNTLLWLYELGDQHLDLGFQAGKQVINIILKDDSVNTTTVSLPPNCDLTYLPIIKANNEIWCKIGDHCMNLNTNKMKKIDYSLSISQILGKTPLHGEKLSKLVDAANNLGLQYHGLLEEQIKLKEILTKVNDPDLLMKYVY